MNEKMTEAIDMFPSPRRYPLSLFFEELKVKAGVDDLRTIRLAFIPQQDIAIRHIGRPAPLPQNEYPCEDGGCTELSFASPDSMPVTAAHLEHETKLAFPKRDPSSLDLIIGYSTISIVPA